MISFHEKPARDRRPQAYYGASTDRPSPALEVLGDLVTLQPESPWRAGAVALRRAAAP